MSNVSPWQPLDVVAYIGGSEGKLSTLQRASRFRQVSLESNAGDEHVLVVLDGTARNVLQDPYGDETLADRLDDAAHVLDESAVDGEIAHQAIDTIRLDGKRMRRGPVKSSLRSVVDARLFRFEIRGVVL